MKIRKRSLSVISSSSWEKNGASTSIDDGDNVQEAEKEEFLFPLVAAAIDVEAKADSALARDSAPRSSPAPEIFENGVHKRTWRNALLGFDEVKVCGEGEKTTCRWNGTKRRNQEDIPRRPKSEACAREGRSSSVEKEISGLDSKLVLPILGGFEKSFMTSEREHDLGLGTVIKKRRIPNGADEATKCNVMELNNGRRKGSTKICSNEDTAKKKDEPETKDKAHVNMDNNKNDDDDGGSQCKRRNGRGWQCSRRTLVGYSLCEHHLGKARFTSINTSDDSVAVNKKGSKFKDLHLIHAASASRTAEL